MIACLPAVIALNGIVAIVFSAFALGFVVGARSRTNLIRCGASVGPLYATGEAADACAAIHSKLK
jgi:hypothetical protein